MRSQSTSKFHVLTQRIARDLFVGTPSMLKHRRHQVQSGDPLAQIGQSGMKNRIDNMQRL